MENEICNGDVRLGFCLPCDVFSEKNTCESYYIFSVCIESIK